MNKESKIYKAMEGKLRKEMKEFEESGIPYSPDSLPCHAPLLSLEKHDTKKENTQRLYASNKFRCPFCDGVYDMSKSVIVQVYPHFFKDTILGYFWGERKMVRLHLDRVTVNYSIAYVRKCKECDKYYNNLILISSILLIIANLFFYLYVAQDNYDGWVYQGCFFLLSLLVFPIIFTLGGERVQYNESKAEEYDALRSKSEYVLFYNKNKKKKKQFKPSPSGTDWIDPLNPSAK